MDEQQGTTRESLPRPLLILIGVASAVIAMGGLKAVAEIAAPVLLAAVLMVTVYPIRGWLVTKGAPSWLASMAIVFTVYLVLIAMVLALVLSVGRLATLVPTYVPQIDDATGNIGTWLNDQGVGQDQASTLVSKLDIGKVVSLATSLLSSILGILTNLFFIATLVLFMGFDAARFPQDLLAARGERPAIVDALLSFASGTRRYYAVSAAFGLIVAIIDTVALALLGIPAAGVWGVLAFVTNFIPNIGFVIGVIPPAVLGLLEGGPSLMLAVIAVYCGINFVIQTLIQPKIVGDALGLSTTLTFLSLVFWTFVLGPLGALLALPMTLLVKALLVDVDPKARWLQPLLSGGSNAAPKSPPDAADTTDDPDA